MKRFSLLMIAKRKFNLLLLGAVALSLSSAVVPITQTVKNPASAKPNIIVILVDDAGYADFGFMGCKDLLTPNIDKLAAQSIRFTDAHVSSSVCSPSRAGLLTGKYQQRFGYECNEGDGYTGMDTLQSILPKILKQRGYVTAAFGKWHLGFQYSQQPLQKGFDYFFGFLSGSRSYFYQPQKDDAENDKRALFENKKQVKFEGYLTDKLGDKAVDYIKQNKNHPFFMYWAPNAVHTPMEASSTDMDKFPNHPRQQLAAMTYSLDRSIGKMIDELKKQGLFENTLIFFLSDNGGAHNNQSSNLPLKGFKGNEYEAGHRVPFFISWPQHISSGSTFQGLSSSLDIFPTALDAAGIKEVSDFGLDGVSLLPFLDGAKNGNPHQQLIWRKDAAAAIRFNQYKLLRIRGLGERLYDTKNDLSETKDLQFEQPAIFSMLQQNLLDWEKDKQKPIWTEGAVWDTITLMIHDDLMNNRKVRVYSPDELQKFKAKNK